MSGENTTDLIIQLLTEGQAQSNSDRREVERRLSEMGASLSGLQTATASLGTQLAEMRAENRAEMQNLSSRLGDVERQVQTLPHTNDRLRMLEDKITGVSAVGDRRHQEVEHRLRHLEGENRETGVFKRGAASVASAVLRYVVPFVAGVLGVAAGMGKLSG